MPALPDYDSPTALKAFLDERGMAMQKKFGQNFMVNRAHRERLVDALGITGESRVWEIGPGLGAMTASILDRGARLTAFEIDRGFCAVLRDIFRDRPNFSLVEGDVLKNWPETARRDGTPSRLFGNLPYNIAAAIVGDMISSSLRFDVIVITVQKEVALRMAARPGTEDYSSFSVLCQWAYRVEPLMDLAAGSFWPRPNVTSRAVRMTKLDDWPRCESPDTFMAVLRALFSSRRKMIRNNFQAWLSQQPEFAIRAQKSSFGEALLARAGIDPCARAETLGVESFLRISDAIEQEKKR
ncbi:MAG TPA: 16S rRNA (adenine(1518)-N(6)/adenine(1519)-N(6))-dimethyltransferase RsmA [Treponemataceae bacterium]|nr:16S rRNA (adenine(1518)-N(6)/adenine(1519)-N(6))-dimethyltransferase RsmA [Treponemataceae bacterium]